MGMLQYAIDVIEGISATVSGGVYNIVSHTPVNPLLLDSTAKGLLETACGHELTPIINDLGETIGYCAKGVANATNGAVTDVSTRVTVLTKEVEVTAEMASETFIEASTGEVAELTVGETVTEVSCGATGAGILAMDVGAAGACIAPALGLVAGFALYNIAPSFWDGVADKLMDAGELINGKVEGILNTDKSTGFSQGTIDVYKEAFREAGYFDKSYNEGKYSEALDPSKTYNINGSNISQSVLNAAQNATITPLNPNIKSETIPSTSYNPTVEISVSGSNVIALIQYQIYDNDFHAYYNNYTLLGKNPFSVTMKSKNGSSSTRNASRIAQNFTAIVNGVSTTYGEVYYLSSNVVTTQVLPLSSPYMTNPRVGWSGDELSLAIFVLLFCASFTASNPNIQDGATTPTQDPIDQTYPDWGKDTIQGKDYYKVSMPTDDTDQSQSQSGDNDSDEQEQDITDTLFNPDPDPEPSPDPEPEPDPQPEPAPLIPPAINPQPVPQDPNPSPEDSDGTPVVPVVPSMSANSLFAVYNPTDAQLSDVGAFLWSTDIIDTIKKIWQNPLEGIIALHKVYAQPQTSGSHNIILGYVDTEVSSLLVSSQFVEVNCGSVTVAENKKNATDYSPFTQIQIYLPFIGIQELDTNEIMGGTVNVKYKIDVYTGTCIAMIFVTRSPDMTNAQLLYTFSGNCSQKLPLTSSDFSNAVGALLGIVGVGIASGGALGAIAGVGAVAHSLTQDMVHIQHSGGLSANSGILAPRKPFIIISRQYGYDANNYGDIYGFPANKTIYLSSCYGFTRVKHINYRGRGTGEEKQMIVDQLKRGVII